MSNVPRQTDPEETNMATLDNCYNIFDMREAAKRRLPRGIFEFVDRATEDHLAVTEKPCRLPGHQASPPSAG